jgi:biofilm PGA synthesis N-glycosyltransferase PgaC
MTNNENRPAMVSVAGGLPGHHLRSDAVKSRYVVVTPVRDEETYLPFTIQSIVKQTILPVEWVIVNDGSKDRTGEIIEEASIKYPWIRAVHRSDRGYRKWGGGIIEAFYDGFNALECRDWDFMCKLDGDLSFDPEYFEGTFKKFRGNPKIGIGGGVLYHYENGKRVLERTPTFHVRGGVKIFRHECWNQIGGLWVGPGSDTIDEVKANMLGWTTMSFADLEMTHHRPTGASWGRWGGIAKNGTISYVAGYHPLYMFAKSLASAAHFPFILAPVALMYGYVTAYLKGVPRVNDPELIKYLQRQQLARLFGQETIWK